MLSNIHYCLLIGQAQNLGSAQRLHMIVNRPSLSLEASNGLTKRELRNVETKIAVLIVEETSPREEDRKKRKLGLLSAPGSLKFFYRFP